MDIGEGKFLFPCVLARELESGKLGLLTGLCEINSPGKVIPSVAFEPVIRKWVPHAKYSLGVYTSYIRKKIFTSNWNGRNNFIILTRHTLTPSIIFKFSSCRLHQNYYNVTFLNYSNETDSLDSYHYNYYFVVAIEVTVALKWHHLTYLPYNFIQLKWTNSIDKS